MQKPPTQTTTPNDSGRRPGPGGLNDRLASFAEQLMTTTGLTAADLLAVASQPDPATADQPVDPGIDVTIRRALRAGWMASAPEPRSSADHDGTDER